MKEVNFTTQVYIQRPGTTYLDDDHSSHATTHGATSVTISPNRPETTASTKFRRFLGDKNHDRQTPQMKTKIMIDGQKSSQTINDG